MLGEKDTREFALRITRKVILFGLFIDLIEPRFNKKVGVIKDMLGGTVLIGIVGACVVGLLILLRVLGVV